ncbi:hypothetical protein ACLBOM_37515 [Escherichia coli]
MLGDRVRDLKQPAGFELDKKRWVPQITVGDDAVDTLLPLDQSRICRWLIRPGQTAWFPRALLPSRCVRYPPAERRPADCWPPTVDPLQPVHARSSAHCLYLTDQIFSPDIKAPDTSGNGGRPFPAAGRQQRQPFWPAAGRTTAFPGQFTQATIRGLSTAAAVTLRIINNHLPTCLIWNCRKIYSGRWLPLPMKASA